MLALGIVVIWAGYAAGSWGYVLIKGWDIPLRQWVSPLSPYQWPKGGAAPPSIPAAQLFPSGKSAAISTAADASPTTASVTSE